MTMGATSHSPSSVSSRDISDSSSPSEVTATIRAATPTQIKAILLADGWHDVKNCQIVQFTLGEAHSPVPASKLYPYLVYQDEGREVYTPMGQILGFDLSQSTKHGGQGQSNR